MGVAVSFIAGIPILILIVMPVGPAKLLGFCLLILLLGFGAIGASGLAARLGERLRDRSAEISEASAYLRGALTLELAAAFPLIGWFVIVPLAIVASLGATVFSLLHWNPSEVSHSPQSIPETKEIARDAVTP